MSFAINRELACVVLPEDIYGLGWEDRVPDFVEILLFDLPSEGQLFLGNDNMSILTASCLDKTRMGPRLIVRKQL